MYSIVVLLEKNQKQLFFVALNNVLQRNSVASGVAVAVLPYFYYYFALEMKNPLDYSVDWYFWHQILTQTKILRIKSECVFRCCCFYFPSFSHDFS